MDKFFDWDDDGIAGNEVLGEGEEIKIEKTLIEIPSTGGSYEVKIEAPIPVYLKKQLSTNSYSTVTEPFVDLYKDTQASHLTSTIKDNILRIEAASSISRKQMKTSLPIYDYVGNVVGKIELVQEGDNGKGFPLLGDGGAGLVQGLKNYLRTSLSYYNLIEQRYNYNKSIPVKIGPSDSDLNSCWGKFYGFNRQRLQFKDLDAQQQGVYQEILNTFGALQYYYMVTLWGDVVYIKDYSEYESYWGGYPRTSSTTIFEDLKNNLKEAIPVLEDKKNEPLKDINGFFCVSKDVARIILADIYMYEKDYSHANDLLKEVIDGGYYKLNSASNSEESYKMEFSTENAESNSSSELIFAIESDLKTKANTMVYVLSAIPVLTYTDVILSYAECQLKLGNQQEAENQLDNIIAAKGIELSEKETLDRITEARKKLLLYSIGNFAFMKRNGLAQKEYGIEDYQLLLPIPSSEISFNPSMNQNPGY